MLQLKGEGDLYRRNFKLIKAREKAGLTQVEVADKANITEACYQRYEYGYRIPRADTAILIARALGTTVEMLFGAQNRTTSTNRQS